MNDPAEPVPPPRAAPAGTAGGTVRYSVPEVARLLRISERAVRKQITAGALDAHKEGNAWVVLLPSTMGAVPVVPAAQEAVPGAVPEGGPAGPDVHEAIIQLRTLLAEERQRADRYLEASTIWQGRARQLEERLQALESGPMPAGEPRQDASRDANTGPQRDDQPAKGAKGLWRRFLRLVERIEES